MDWINSYDLFLFDFDGLLVNTESVHFQAYVNMCSKRGYTLPFDFTSFISIAHQQSYSLQNAIYDALPGLKEKEPNWSILYEEKKTCYLELLNKGSVHLMPGALPLLQNLEKQSKKRCVVTNSPKEQIDCIKACQPILNTISHWITRECYEKAKPHPECYLQAIKNYGEKRDKIIGFEDSLRGIKALLQTPAKAVLVCPLHYPLIDAALEERVVHVSSLDMLSEKALL